MQQHEIHHFLLRYFHANHCEILENKPGYLVIQLTVELDKELMNRPFYWHYLEKTGGVANPMELTLITNPSLAPDDIKGEIIHFGSPRLHQIFQSTKNLAGYIRLYENYEAPPGTQTALRPWLGLNLRISYQCDRKKDLFKSIGLHLINGQMVEQFHDKLLHLSLTPKIPDFSFTLSPFIKPQSGVMRVANFLQSEIEKEDHTWADEARLRWQKDLQLLERFYEDADEKGESFENEMTALQEQYEPQVHISIVNGGLFYLTDEAIS
ncbi:YqhG family protein [Cytobacillus sp. FSL W7-1323]|uniref:YqhG family protein n=1 Tax=Cytobacillus TaxID=2675230 RepID=UPI001CD1CC0A|nr:MULTISPECIES: YqhG family protein [Cytobacillus]MCA1025511.1 YqhG family protein [Cytobacillus kochii]MCM3320614.1 YqhG family protein [Cytobacillus kochii]MCM3344552.1 YqhG family protein [Cytobacillus kochii]MDM5208395.1 YqhG family protein [Cytobacillus kochii]MEA1853071.1 YqhG family protein [Cytobacillus sp. OWB-43]